MTLWNIIRDFFVHYVFGGYDSVGDMFNDNFVGSLTRGVDGSDLYNTYSYYINIGIAYDNYNDAIGETFISFGDWLSTTATIITLVALFIGISCLMVSLFRWIVRLVSLRG